MKALLWIVLLILFVLVCTTGNAFTFLGMWDVVLVDMETGEYTDLLVFINRDGEGITLNRLQPITFNVNNPEFGYLVKVLDDNQFTLYLKPDKIMKLIEEIPRTFPPERWREMVVFFVHYYHDVPVGKAIRRIR